MEESQMASGGEGEIYRLRGDGDKVAKIYHKTPLSPGLIDKLNIMVKHASSFFDGYGERNIAWHLDVLYDNNKQIVGYIMPKLNIDGSSLQQAYPQNPIPDSKILSYKERVKIAEHLCRTLIHIHTKNCIFGDFNFKNIGFSFKNCTVFFFDSDTYHMVDKKIDKIYPCLVGLPGYIAPEILSKLHKYKCNTLAELQQKTETFTKESDFFCLAIHLFKLLNEGLSPYSGLKGASGERSKTTVDLSDPENVAVRDNHYVFRKGYTSGSLSGMLLLDAFTPEIANLFTRAFVNGRGDTSQRPTAEEWLRALIQYEKGLVQCKKDTLHQYHSKNKTCPYCEAQERQRNAMNVGGSRITISNTFSTPSLYTRQQTIKPNRIPPPHLSYGIRILPAVALLSVYEIGGGIAGAIIGVIIPYFFSAILGIIVGAIVIGLIGLLGGVPGCIGGAIIGAIIGFCSVFQQPPTMDTTLYNGLIRFCAVIGSIWGGIVGGRKAYTSTSGWLSWLNPLGKYPVIGIGLTTELLLLVAFLPTQYYRPYLQQYNSVPIEASSDPSGTPVPIKDLAIFEVAEKGTVQDLQECIVDIVMKKQVVEKGCVHMRDVQYGATLLHRAAWHNKNVDVVKYLVSSGADINANDREYGATPLHWAAENENVNIAKYLVSQGADVNAKNKNGMTPLDHAKRAGNTAVVEFLSKIK